MRKPPNFYPTNNKRNSKKRMKNIKKDIIRIGKEFNSLKTNKNEEIIIINNKIQKNNHLISFNYYNKLKNLFLPLNYPSSVKKEYLEYQIYDSIQGLCSYLRGVLCTHAILVAAGVGIDNVNAWSATLTWIFKDGIGMIFSILFTSKCSFYFGSYVKEWRLFADLINDVALTIDILCPFFPRSLHVYILSLSAICKSMCGISANSTKLCITNHLCLQSNEADVNAKESSQETAICLIGLVIGMLLSQLTQNISNFSYILFTIFTLVHIYCNYYAVKCLQFQTINRTRGYLLINLAINFYYYDENNSTTPSSSTRDIWNNLSKNDENTLELSFTKSLLSISRINSLDSVILTLQLVFNQIPNNRIYLGVSMLDGLNQLQLDDNVLLIEVWEKYQKVFQSKNYCILPRKKAKGGGYNVLFRSKSTQVSL